MTYYAQNRKCLELTFETVRHYRWELPSSKHESGVYSTLTSSQIHKLYSWDIDCVVYWHNAAEWPRVDLIAVTSLGQNFRGYVVRCSTQRPVDTQTDRQTDSYCTTIIRATEYC